MKQTNKPANKPPIMTKEDFGIDITGGMLKDFIDEKMKNKKCAECMTMFLSTIRAYNKFVDMKEKSHETK